MELLPQLSQQMSAQMLQYMNLLQMNLQELNEFLTETYQENPAIELRERVRTDGEAGGVRAVSGRVPTASTADFRSIVENATIETGTEGLEEHLCAQLGNLPAPIDAAARFIIHNLDDSGFLDSAISEAAAKAGISASDFRDGLKVVRGLEPKGVGACDIRECLLLQLEVSDVLFDVKRVIIREHLEALAKSRYNQIAKQLHLPNHIVHHACREIKALNPRPGSGFGTASKTQYVVPDVIVSFESDEVEIVLNNGNLPAICVDDFCRTLLHETDDPQVKTYLHEKLNQANWLVRSLEQREETILACMKAIAGRQREFLLRGEGYLVPMTLEMIAEEVGVHPSTVSRAVSGKYVQCRYGVYPVSRLFSRELSTGGKYAEPSYSQDRVKKLLSELIGKEDPKKPYSDDRLCKMLLLEGIEVSRRTVAKYRLEMEIPNASGRKKL